MDKQSLATSAGLFLCPSLHITSIYLHTYQTLQNVGNGRGSSKFHFQRDWKAISDGNSISNVIGSPLRGHNSISNVIGSPLRGRNSISNVIGRPFPTEIPFPTNVIGRPFPTEIPFPTRLEAFCADAMAFPTFLKGLRACHDSVTIL